MIFMDEKPSVIQSFACMVITGYAVVINVSRAAEGHGIVRENFYP